MSLWLQELRPALVLLAVLTGLTGIVYPLAVTAVAQLVFPARANGSLVRIEGRIVGSELLGQSFTDPGRFWGRPSATAPVACAGEASSGSNLGPLSSVLVRDVHRRIATLRAADPGNHAPIPVDLVTASASGLDPHVSPAAALWQVPRVARARGLAPERVEALVRERTLAPTLGFLGERRVDVLLLNLALDHWRKGIPPRDREGTNRRR